MGPVVGGQLPVSETLAVEIAERAEKTHTSWPQIYSGFTRMNLKIFYREVADFAENESLVSGSQGTKWRFQSKSPLRQEEKQSTEFLRVLCDLGGLMLST